MMGSDGLPISGPKCPFIPFFSTNAFWPDLSKIFSRRMHISSDFDYFPHISDLFWIILGTFEASFEFRGASTKRISTKT